MSLSLVQTAAMLIQVQGKQGRTGAVRSESQHWTSHQYEADNSFRSTAVGVAHGHDASYKPLLYAADGSVLAEYRPYRKIGFSGGDLTSFRS